jgi:hypothetical protein
MATLKSRWVDCRFCLYREEKTGVRKALDRPTTEGIMRSEDDFFEIALQRALD